MNTAVSKIKRITNFNNDKILIIVVACFGIIAGFMLTNGNWLYLGILLVPLMLYWCVVKPFIFPFGLYALLIPFDSILSIVKGAEGGATLTKFLGLLTILVLFINGIYYKKLYRPRVEALCWMLFVMYGILSFLWAIESDAVLSRIPTAAGLLLLYLIISSYKIKNSEFSQLKLLILAGGFLASVFSIHSYGMMDTAGRTTLEVGGRMADINSFAFSLLVPVSICIENIMSQPKKITKFFLCIMLCVMIFGIIITGSRGNMLGVAVIFFIYIINLKKRIAFGASIVVVSMILLLFLPEWIFERWGTTLESGGSGRFTIWHIGFEVLKKYWAFGAGLNNFPTAYGQFAYIDTGKGWYRAAHNTYLGLLCEFGIIGFSLMIMALAKHYNALKLKYTHYRVDTIMLKSCFWAVLVSIFFSDAIWNKPFWLLFILIMMHKNVNSAEKFYDTFVAGV